MKMAWVAAASLIFILFLVNLTLGYDVNAVSFGGESLVFVEMAKTPDERSRGLMQREGLLDGTGMLFIFEFEERHGFWMKNMEFPIDIIWLDRDGVVVDVAYNVLPCGGDICPVYEPALPAKYVLEVASGEARALDAELGVRAVFVQSRSGQ